MKKFLVVILALLLMSALVLGACSQEAEPAATTAPETAATEAPATEAPAAADVVELKLAHAEPPTSNIHLEYEQWVQEVEKATEGRVKITIYPAETLGKQFDYWDMLKGGMIDITSIIPGMVPGEFPLSDVGDMPYVLPSNPEVRNEVLTALYDEFLYTEWGDIQVLWMDTGASVQLNTVEGKAVRTLEDLEGLQIRTPGGIITSYMQALGATPATIPAPEIYTSLEKNMVDGCTFPLSAVKSFSLAEVTKYHTMISPGFSLSVTGMNLNTWNSLPADIQGIITELGPLGSQLRHEGSLAAAEAAEEELKQIGNEVIYLSAEERARWAEATKPVVDEWVAEMDAKGLPATELIEEANTLSVELAK